jgi:poly(3-hydroxyalkanoate) synthetase
MKNTGAVSAIKRLKKEGNSVGYSIEGRLTANELTEIHKELEDMIKVHRTINVLVSIKDFNELEPEALVKDLKFATHYLDNFNKIAILGNESWQRFLASLADQMLITKVRFFHPSTMEEAWNWLKQD